MVLSILVHSQIMRRNHKAALILLAMITRNVREIQQCHIQDVMFVGKKNGVGKFLDGRWNGFLSIHVGSSATPWHRPTVLHSQKRLPLTAHVSSSSSNLALISDD